MHDVIAAQEGYIQFMCMNGVYGRVIIISCDIASHRDSPSPTPNYVLPAGPISLIWVIDLWKEFIIMIMQYMEFT